jgi:hypothetical protein
MDYYRPPGTAGLDTAGATTPPPPADPGIEVDWSLSLRAAAGALERDRDRQEQLTRHAANGFTQVEFGGAITLTAGAGTLQDPGRFGCPQGYIWSIRRLTTQGFTAGTVIAYRDSIVGEPLMPFPVPSVNTFGKGEIILKRMSQIVWNATGIVGSVQIWGAVDQIESWMFPWYMQTWPGT